MQRKIGQYWQRKWEKWTNFIPDDPPVICAMINAEKTLLVSLQMYSFLSLLIFIHLKLSCEFSSLILPIKKMFE